MRQTIRMLLLLAVAAGAGFLLPASFATAGGKRPPSGVTRLSVETLTVTGLVRGIHGGPLAGARVALEGFSGPVVETREDGTYAITLPISEVVGDGRHPVRFELSASRAGMDLTRPGREATFAIELGIFGAEDGDRCRIRANDARALETLSRALSDGEISISLPGVDFAAGERPLPSSLRLEGIVVLPANARLATAGTTGSSAGDMSGPAAPAAAKSAPASKPRAPAGLTDDEKRATPQRKSASPKPAEEVRASEKPPAKPPANTSRPVRVRRVGDESLGRVAPDEPARGGNEVKLPGPGVTQTDASIIRRLDQTGGRARAIDGAGSKTNIIAKKGECGCRVRGTIELHPDHLLSSGMLVVVGIADQPAVSDTVELFMGSPRAFELPEIRCGTYRLEIAASARRDFAIVSADGRNPVDCSRGGLRQLRIVLEPR